MYGIDAYAFGVFWVLPGLRWYVVWLIDQLDERRVINDLKANGYLENFIKSVDQPNNTQPKPRENPKA